MGVLSLGLLLPLGTGTVTDGAAKTLAAATSPTSPKHVTLVRDGTTQQLQTRAATAEDLLAENGVTRNADDALSVDPTSPLVDGETVTYRSAVAVTVVIDGQSRDVRSAAASVGELLKAQGIAWDRHDRISPAPATPLTSNETIRVLHVNAWTEAVHKPIPAKVVKKLAFGLGHGKTKVVDPGRAGVREIAYIVSRSPDRRSVRRTQLASRVLVKPHNRIIAEGVGDFAALTRIAERGVEGTLKFASAALSMVATAYTANCSGCSGITAIGRPAGHGIVAVDPHVIPLGTAMYIPGYGHAIAGDTGGAIRGNRIDLGFDSLSDARIFGRRPITVYLLK
jgi:3D (Asp-Asp-Asp) domain-containing protein